jgi:hypothetical protein
LVGVPTDGEEVPGYDGEKAVIGDTGTVEIPASLPETSVHGVASSPRHAHREPLTRD